MIPKRSFQKSENSRHVDKLIAKRNTQCRPCRFHCDEGLTTFPENVRKIAVITSNPNGKSRLKHLNTLSKDVDLDLRFRLHVVAGNYQDALQVILRLREVVQSSLTKRRSDNRGRRWSGSALCQAKCGSIFFAGF